MKAYDHALEMFLENGYSEDEMMEDVRWHIQNGYAYFSPLEFVLARPVSSKWDTTSICGMRESKDALNMGLTNTLDMWHIHVAIGDMRELLSHLPYTLPYISFERRGVFKRYNYSRFNEISQATETAETNSTGA